MQTSRGGLRTVRTDAHITVFCGRSDELATRQGHVFLLVQQNNRWRIMEDYERTVEGRALELYPYPAQRRRR